MTDNGGKTLKKKSNSRYGGIILGLIFGVFVVGSYLMSLPRAELQDTSIAGLVLTAAVFAAIGGIFGENFMEKLGEWLRWFL